MAHTARTLRRFSVLEWKAIITGLALILAATNSVTAALPTDPAARAQLVGQPASLLVQPAAIKLAGPRALQQLVVTGRYADGSVRDLTHFGEMTFEPADVVVAVDGFLQPRKNGTTTLVIKAGGQVARVPV